MEKPFHINAKTCTLIHNDQQSNDSILGNGKKYVIPIYQRPYSWSDEQIKKLVTDVFTSFKGISNSVTEEPMFIGSMQLSYLDENNAQQVIDGQQRLTTFLLIFKVLMETFPNLEELQKIGLGWLTTKSNNGSQQTLLNECLETKLDSNPQTINPYLKNAVLIKELIKEQTANEENKDYQFPINQFVKYLVSKVYFVVIETQAGLSKTLQIFKAINTTGLDLNGGDIFKIKLYEYLRDKKNMPEETFEKINEIYKSIEERNQYLKSHVTSIEEILDIYKYIIVAKYKLPTSLYWYSSNTFFEQLFETLLNVNQWNFFKGNVQKVEVSIKEIQRIIDVRFKWEEGRSTTLEDACSWRFVTDSRYGRYWILFFVFLYRFYDEDRWNKLETFIKHLGKYYFVYSVRYLKAINSVHQFTYELLSNLLSEDKPFDEIIEQIKQGIGSEKNQNPDSYDLDYFLVNNLTENHKRKYLICRLSAMLEEDYTNTNSKIIEDIVSRLFDGSSQDVEHIQSYHDCDGKVRAKIWEDWKEDINSLGNLMLLEQRINRSISNNDYSRKLPRYKESNFKIVQKQVENYSQTWFLEDCRKRKDAELQKLKNYLFS